MFEPFTNSLGTGILLRHLDGVIKTAEVFIACTSDSDASDVLDLLSGVDDAASALDSLTKTERRGSPASLRSLSKENLVHLQPLCACVETITRECVELLAPLKSALEGAVRDSETLGYSRADHRLTSQTWYKDVSNSLRIRRDALRILLSAVNLLYRKNNTNVDGDLTADALQAASQLRYGVEIFAGNLEEVENYNSSSLRRAVVGARRVLLHVPSTLNRHFLMGRSAKTFYTGREKQMNKVKKAFEDNTYAGQKRFIVYGLGGSGKTELAVKYAEDHMQNFWGVFFVDASSRKNAAGSYSEIAKIGGVEPNERAAKSWLATRRVPWLLIVDNADDDEVQLDELVPAGKQGYILVTSRNPAHKSFGTVGERYLELLPMEEEEANELILRAAQEPTPWAKAVTEPASAICKALGYLPLALVHAGKAILEYLPWSEYLEYYNIQAKAIRRRRSLGRDRSSSRCGQLDGQVEDFMNVFSSFELLYQSLEVSDAENFRDAIELLHLFSFFHFQNIRLDILTQAAANPRREAKAREEQSKEDQVFFKRMKAPKQKSWLVWLRELVLHLARYQDPGPPLPALLRNSEGLSESVFEDEVLVRLRRALMVLVSRSLVMRQDKDEGRYCMHTLVHKWIRERPQTSTAQQALWCQEAATTLASSILLPPLGDSEAERNQRRELLPHILHVCERQAELNAELKRNSESRGTGGFRFFVSPDIHVRFGRLQANEAARFSRVFSECGLFGDARRLQEQVRGFLVGALGQDHPICILITLFLANTLWELSEAAQATRLQRETLEVCIRTLGDDHPLTLRVSDLLASALCFQGRWSESRALQEKTVEGMRQIYGEDHDNTLKAINNLGRVNLRFMAFEVAADLHETAWQGMKTRLGDSHPDTLICLEDMAMARMRLGDSYLEGVHDQMVFVLERRRELLGKEQPYTLLATCNLGRVKSAMGKHKEAAQIMSEAVLVAERNLGRDHFGVLAGKTHYAQVLVRLLRFAEAETIFHDIIDKPLYRKSSSEDGEHPDRMIALWYLAGCLEKQGKYTEALKVCKGLVGSLRDIGGHGLGTKHKFAVIVQEEIEKLKRKIDDPSWNEDGAVGIPCEL